MAKKYGLAYSDESIVESITEDRVTFTAEFEYRRPDEAFSTISGTRNIYYAYGPMVGFVKKFTIVVKDDINIELRQFKINDFELGRTQYTVTESGEGINRIFTIEHSRPSLIYDVGIVGEHGRGYIDPTDSDPNKFKYFLFDPVEITIRAKYSDEFLASLNDAAISILNRRAVGMRKKYDIPDLGYDEIEPLKFSDYWLKERVDYLFEYEQIGSAGDSDYEYFPPPFHNYQVHRPGNSSIPAPIDDNDITGVVSADLLQQMRFAAYYSQYRSGIISALDMERMFGHEWDLGGGNLDIVAWDGVALEPITNKEGKPAGFKQPRGKYVKLSSTNKTAPICYGCNRHPTWMCPVENGEELEEVDTKFCEDADPPQTTISTKGPLDVKDIPRTSPVIKIEETGYMTGIGKKPAYPTTIKREHFDRFFLLFSNIHRPPQNDPLPKQYVSGSVRIVPDRSDIKNLLSTDQLDGHIEICPRRAVEGLKSSYKEIDGTKLSDIEFNLDQDGNEEIRYPYSFRSTKNYRDQFRSMFSDWQWDKLNIAKIYTKPTFPVKLQTKRAYKSLDYIRGARIYIVTEVFSPETTNTPADVYNAGNAPGIRERRCCRWTNPFPVDCRCPVYEMHFYENTWVQHDVVKHYFAVFNNSPVADNMLKYYSWIPRIRKAWGMRLRPEDLPKGARVRVPITRTFLVINEREADPDSACAPGLIGYRDGGFVREYKLSYVPLDDMDPDEAQKLLDELLENAADHPCFTAPKVNNTYDIIVGYKRVEYTGLRPIIPGGYFQWLGYELMVPTTWCTEDLRPGRNTDPLMQSWYEQAWQPGGPAFDDKSRNNYVEVNAGGNWTNTLANQRENPPGWFDYTFYCDHSFNFRDGVYTNCRCEVDGIRIF